MSEIENTDNVQKVNEVVTDRRKIASKENIRKALAKRNEILKEKKRLKEELEKSKEESDSDSDTEEIIYIHPKKGTKKYVKSLSDTESEIKPPIESKIPEQIPVKERVLKRTVSEYPVETKPPAIEVKTDPKPSKAKARYSFLMLDE